MKKFLSLVRLLFVQQYRVMSVTEKKKRIGTIIAIVVLALCFLPMISSIIVGTYTIGTLVGQNTGIGAFLILICQGLVLLFGTQTIITTVFNSSDADKLLYLPIKPTTIFLAKLTVVYLNEVITSAVAFLVIWLPFGIGAQVSAVFYLMLPVALLLLPILPLFVGCVISMPIAALLAKLKNSGTVKMVIQVLSFVLIMGLYTAMIMGFNNLNNGLEPDADIEVLISAAIDTLKNVGDKISFLHCNLMLAVAMFSTTFGSWFMTTFATVLENALLLAIVVLLALPFYRWVLSASLETGVASRKGGSATLRINSKGMVRDLISTDFKRTVRNTQLGFQCFAGLVVMPLIVVLLSLSFTGGDVSIMDEVTASPLYAVIAPLLLLAYMSLLGIGTNVLGLYPISRENKSLYLLKSLPVPFHKILLSKVVLATVVMLICDFLTCLLVVLLFEIQWYIGIAMLVVMALLGFGGMCITTLTDLKSPKLGWTNFNQSLKNAKNSWIAMLIGLLQSVAVCLVAVPFVIIYAAYSAWYVMLFMWLLIAILCAVYAYVCYKIMVSKATKYFEQIDA